MKRSRGKRTKSIPPDEVAVVFARGFLVTGLLVALQDRCEAGSAAPAGRKIMRHALQGGAALAAGTVAAEALGRRDLSLAAGAVAAGAAGVLAAEILLNSPPPDDHEEKRLGQEEG
ncbi:MAG: hypothetical protein NVV74_03305 [Magnetospirillum sp.]|nr:hypothetical protein [Magnetospirillum sp.]